MNIQCIVVEISEKTKKWHEVMIKYVIKEGEANYVGFKTNASNLPQKKVRIPQATCQRLARTAGAPMLQILRYSMDVSKLSATNGASMISIGEKSY